MVGGTIDKACVCAGFVVIVIVTRQNSGLGFGLGLVEEIVIVCLRSADEIRYLQFRICKRLVFRVKIGKSGTHNFNRVSKIEEKYLDGLPSLYLMI